MKPKGAVYNPYIDNAHVGLVNLCPNFFLSNYKLAIALEEKTKKQKMLMWHVCCTEHLKIAKIVMICHIVFIDISTHANKF